MELLLLIFYVLFILIFAVKEKRLKARLLRLEKVVVDLENELSKWTARKSAPEAAPEPEKGPVQNEAQPQAAGVRKPVIEDTQPPAEALFHQPPPQPAETFEAETLADLDLPAEEISMAEAQGPSSDETIAEPQLPIKKPSVWSERWQAFKANVDWEQFTGVKLFAWLGGVAFFIAAGLFVKVSIDRNWIPPALRLAVSALIGTGLIISAGRFSDSKYRVMRHTLAASGIGVLYSVVFAATLYYQYLTKPLGFGMLTVVSVAAFVLAVFYRSKAVCLLGALGAYATPILVSTGQGHLLMLLGYLAVVNLGLYQVARRLTSLGLMLAAVAGTSACLGIATWSVFNNTSGIVIAGTWILNLGLFVFFLGHADADPDETPSARWAGILSFSSTLIVAASLLFKFGWAPLLVVTVAQAAAIGLALRKSGWYRYVIPYGGIGFMVALVWVVFNFTPSQFSIGFVLLLFYGGVGGLGPLALVFQYGLNRKVLFWFRSFPLAIVIVSLAAIIQNPMVSFWFWPLLLCLELIGIGISILFRAFVQVGLLVLIFVLGALNWLLNVPSEDLGIGFFLFIIGAGLAMCVAVFLLVRRLPEMASRLNLDQKGAASWSSLPSLSVSEQWLSAAPAAGVCVLLAASFFVNYPKYPHPGMATLLCFLVLSLFGIRRLGYEIPGIAALLGAAAAQAVFVFHPVLGPPVHYAALFWSAGLFLAALYTPFLFFNNTTRWKRLWHGWALFEVIQAVFLLFVTQQLWHSVNNQWMAQWLPLAMSLLKLPMVTILVRRLHESEERNSILAFHGGVLLFYICTLPVLVLEHGWIGLAFVFEATALVWLNRRIVHAGLRWVALVLAPTGLIILFLHLPQLKAIDSLPLLNSAVLATLACVFALTATARMADFPQRTLRRIDLPNYFLWLSVVSGFILINMVVADLFAEPGMGFKVWPNHDFVQWACYALGWIAMGGFLRRLTGLPNRFRMFGLALVTTGAIIMIALPLTLPESAARMRPLFNSALALYLPLLAMLYFLFHKEPWQDPHSLIKNGLLALFLIAAFIAFKYQKGILADPGYPFALLTSHTPAKGATSSLAWFIYGIGLLLWPRRLDRPFRIAGILLILLGVGKALLLPFKFRVLFAQMTPLLNLPTMVYVICLAALIYLTLRQWDARWPLPRLIPRLFWGIVLALTAFAILNIEIASVFALKDRPFSMMTHGSLSMQLAYSIGWLLFAIGLLIVGIRWGVVQVRWTAIAAIVATAFKIFLRDVWSLGSMYRVGSVLGLAVVLVLVSFLYQRFLSEGIKDVP